LAGLPWSTRGGLVALTLLLAACGSNDGSEDGASGASGSSGQSGASGNGGTGSSGTSGQSGAGGSGSSGASGNGGTGSSGTCGNGSPTLAVVPLTTLSVAAMGTPDDTAAHQLGPYEWGGNYGTAPEIVAKPYSGGLDILWQDHAASNKAFLLRVEGSAGSYAVTAAWELETLGKIMGLDRDGDGNFVVASGVDEESTLTSTWPAPGEHRPDIVRLSQFDGSGCVLREIDVDMARQAKQADSEPIINPMTAATSRLVVHGTEVALLHGINTDYDAKVDARHQKALTTHLDLSTGLVTRTSTMWMSHSFDQRLFFDGQGFVELHIGDAYDRAIALGRFTPTQDDGPVALFRPKGALGENSTCTRLGAIEPIASGDYGYLVAFTTDRSPTYPSGSWATVDDHFELGLLRVKRSFASGNEPFVDSTSSNVSQQVVTSSGESVTNYVQWLTDYSSGAHAVASRMVGLGGDQYLVLWERWTGTSGDDQAYAGTWATVVDAAGNTVQAAKQIGSEPLSLGDDAVLFDGKALFVTGDSGSRQLVLNFVSSTLETSTVPLP